MRYTATTTPVIALAVAGLAAGCAAAPEPAGPMVTDRPDFTESASAVAAGRVQLEAGATLERANGASSWSVGEVLARVGLMEGVEARLGVNAAAGDEPSGIEDPTLGVKVELPSPSWIHDLALLAGATVPVGTEEVGGGSVVPSAILAAAWDSRSGLGAGLNLGYAHLDTPSGDGEWSGSAAVGIPLSDRWGAFVEAYGLHRDGGSSLFADAGVTWLLQPDLQLDVRAGRQLDAPNALILGVGLSTRW